jgi:hypothetical protein
MAFWGNVAELRSVRWLRGLTAKALGHQAAERAKPAELRHVVFSFRQPLGQRRDPLAQLLVGFGNSKTFFYARSALAFLGNQRSKLGIQQQTKTDKTEVEHEKTTSRNLKVQNGRAGFFVFKAKCNTVVAYWLSVGFRRFSNGLS